MAEGCILTRTSNYAFVDDVTYQIPWQAEQILGANSHSFWDGSTKLQIPSEYYGNYVEIFMNGDGEYLDTTDDGYIGVIAGGQLGPATWYGIKRDLGLMSRGYRSGPIFINGINDVQMQIRTFGDKHRNMLSRGTTMGCLVGIPDPIGLAVTTGNPTATGVATTTFAETAVHDPNSIYSAGVFTAPVGAECYTASVAAYGDVSDSGDRYWQLFKNGIKVTEYMHAASIRAASPGTFGLHPCVAGDEITIRMYNGGTTTNLNQFRSSVEFY